MIHTLLFWQRHPQRYLIGVSGKPRISFGSKENANITFSEILLDRQQTSLWCAYLHAYQKHLSVHFCDMMVICNRHIKVQMEETFLRKKKESRNVSKLKEEEYSYAP